MPRQTKDVTETEFAILKVLWDRGPTTVRGIVEAIYRQHTHSLHTSVKSLLERLADKEFAVCQRKDAASTSSRPSSTARHSSPSNCKHWPTATSAARCGRC